MKGWKDYPKVHNIHFDYLISPISSSQLLCSTQFMVRAPQNTANTHLPRSKPDTETESLNKMQVYLLHSMGSLGSCCESVGYKEVNKFWSPAPEMEGINILACANYRMYINMLFY